MLRHNKEKISKIVCVLLQTMAYNLSCSSNSIDQKRSHVYMYYFSVIANIMTLLNLEEIVADLKIIICNINMTEEAERAYMCMMRRMQVGYNVYYHSGNSKN